MNVCCGVNVRPWHQRREHLELTGTRQIVQGNPVPGTGECHSWPTFGFQTEQPVYYFIHVQGEHYGGWGWVSTRR